MLGNGCKQVGPRRLTVAVLRRARPYSQLQDAWPAVSAACLDEAQQAHAEVADALRMVRACCSTALVPYAFTRQKTLHLPAKLCRPLWWTCSAAGATLRRRWTPSAVRPGAPGLQRRLSAARPLPCEAQAFPGTLKKLEPHCTPPQGSLCRKTDVVPWNHSSLCFAWGSHAWVLSPVCLTAFPQQEGVRAASAAGRLLHRLADSAEGCLRGRAAQPAGQPGSDKVRT